MQSLGYFDIIGDSRMREPTPAQIALLDSEANATAALEATLSRVARTSWDDPLIRQLAAEWRALEDVRSRVVFELGA